jgi:integrase
MSSIVKCSPWGPVSRHSRSHSNLYQPAREAADLPWVGFHVFRHTCASILFAEGRNAVQVQRWLGHHSAAFTLATYVHLLDGDLGEPLAILQEGRHNAELAG